MEICFFFLIIFSLFIFLIIKRSENWLNLPFSKLDSAEVEETLREGSFLLQNLEEDLEQNENILKMIRQLETEVNKLNELLYLILMLKHQAFKTPHWNVFIN